MKTIASALIALSVLAGIAAPASALDSESLRDGKEKGKVSGAWPGTF